MNTYTIALDGDVLMATALDGDTGMMEARLADSLSQISDEDREAVAERISYISGLSLYASEDDAEDAGAEVVYRGCDMGWLEDAEGRMEYMAAGRSKKA